MFYQMPNLKALTNRIKSVKSTRKITKVMKTIAAAKVSPATKSSILAKSYSEEIQRCLIQAISNFSDTLPWQVTGGPGENPRILIAISSARGMCGTYNASIAKSVATVLEDWGNNTCVIAIGKKISDYIKRNHPSIVTLYHQDKPELSMPLAEDLIRTALETEPAKIAVVYTKFISGMKQQVSTRHLLPFAADVHMVCEPHYCYEPSNSSILESLPQQVMQSILYSCLANSLASEHCARMLAMDNATKNAKEVIDDLTLQYNRTRQAMITKELIEIISSAESLQG